MASVKPETGGGNKSNNQKSNNQGKETPQTEVPQQVIQAQKKQRSDFEFGKILGEGSYSEVVQAIEKTTRKEYAIKILTKRQMIRENKQKYVMRERDVLARLNHPFFVKLYFTFQDKERLYFGLSLAKRGELLPYIHKVGSFDEITTRFYAAEIVLALEHMHSLGIIHRDLKPENILLNEEWHIQITDFGSAKILEADSTDGIVRANSFVGTAQYVSPELLTTNRTERVEKSASKCSDLWALGAIIYQMSAGLPPFRAGTEYLIFQKILKLDYVFPDGFPEKAKDLVQKLLVIDPKKRLGCNECGGYAELKEHQFFQGVNWENIHKQTPPALKPFTMLDGEEIHSDYYVDDFNILSNSLSEDFQKINTNETENYEKTHSRKYVLDPTSQERTQLLLKQEKDVKWHQFVNGNLILKMGLLDKRKGLFARRRNFLLTEGPHLYYVDPERMILKGEIPWSRTMKVEAKNFKTFFVHTPNRTYYLIDPEGYALEWCRAIEEMMHYTYKS
ncbi:3-phosphoinositide-dependent protein kinase 1-like isoform X2 [Antedon mediterranea]|uniref:3-phosphoinositide-dependent protein kinase 1-like isoform X2 n=1 Tax=Antedon mediterranea TaxID=105859 RepID=UPI003AF94F9B